MSIDTDSVEMSVAEQLFELAKFTGHGDIEEAERALRIVNTTRAWIDENFREGLNVATSVAAFCAAIAVSLSATWPSIRRR